MKITIATGPIFPVPAFLGGAVQRRWDGMSREFARAGHDITVFAKLGPGQSRQEFAHGIHYVRWGGYEISTSIWRDLVRCFWYALRAVPRVPSSDIVVTNDFWTPVLLPRLRPRCGKVVAGVARFPKGQFWMYNRVDSIAAVSRVVADEICRQTPSIASKVTYIPNCIDDAFLPPVRSASMAGGRQSRRPIRLLFAGRIHPEKGVRLLIEAFKCLATRVLPPWECVIVGPTSAGEGGGGEAFAQMLRANFGLLPIRMLAPTYSTVELASLYDTCDIFVYPSLADRGEAFGLAPLEAMARGLVPILSDLSVFREYLEPGTNGVAFDHRSDRAAENLAEALRELIRDAGRRERMAVAARQTAERFSTAAIAERYLKLFAETLQSGQ
jgi:glycosyltransferase involved in cell wall biosynthesis